MERDSERKNAIVLLPYTSRIDKRGKIRMSSHSALVTEAGRLLFNEGVAPYIYIPGESTFGDRYISTGELMKTQLLKRGVPESQVIISKNLNNTQDQLLSTKLKNFDPVFVVAMRFHIPRVALLEKQIGLVAQNITAEDVFIDLVKGATKSRLQKLSDTKIRILGVSKVRFAEFIGYNGTRFGNLGKSFIEIIRTIAGQNGPTVTDYHHVESAKKHFKKALNQGLNIH